MASQVNSTKHLRKSWHLSSKYFFLIAEEKTLSNSFYPMWYTTLAKWRIKTIWSSPSVQSLSRVWLFATPWIAARQASLSITNSRSSLGLASIESVMPSSHLILGRPLLLLPPVPPSIRVFSNEDICPSGHLGDRCLSVTQTLRGSLEGQMGCCQ